MLASFNSVKAQYGADTSLMSFEAAQTTELGDTLQQLHVSNPPILAVIQGQRRRRAAVHRLDHEKVMEQVVANAIQRPLGRAAPHRSRPAPRSV